MERSVIIRKPRLLDARAIAEVHVASWLEAYRDLLPEKKLAQLDLVERESAWDKRLAKPEPHFQAFVAEVDGAVVAYAFAQPSSDEDLGSDVHELTALYLLPSVWGRGIGTALLTAVESGLRDTGAEGASLWVLEGNLRAIGFYEAHGWEFDRRDPSFRDFGVPALRYRRVLGC